MTEFTPATFNAARTIGLVQAMLAPRDITVAPPNLYQENTFMKQLTVQGSFAIKEASTLVEEKVPVSTGCVVWFPQRGVQSIYRYGLVGKTTVSYTFGSPVIPPGRAVSYGLNIRLFNALLQPFVNSLTYNAPLWLPYGDASGFDDQITVSPALEKNVSFARVIAGAVELISDTQSIGNTALTGRLAWGAISDTRDVAQALQEAGSYHAYDPADLQQQSITKKDGEVESSIMTGCVSLVGPDIAPQFMAPNADSQDYLCGQWGKFNNREGVVTTTFGIDPTSWTHPSLLNLDSTFISPWNVQANPSAQIIAVGHFTNLDTPALDECGVLDIQADFDVSWVHNGGDAVAADALFKLSVCVQHIYATVQSDGRIWYKTSASTYYERNGRAGDTTNFSHFTAVMNDATTKRDSYTGSLSGGKYIGSLVSLVFEGTTIFAGTAPGNTITFNIAPTVFTLRGRTIGQRGYVGPTRIMRYDNVSSGQNVRLSGVLNAQMVPQGTLAPYTQNEAGSTTRCVDLNAIPLAAQLWNAPNTPFRRIYNLDYYKEVIRGLALTLNPQQLLDIAGQDPELLGAFNSSGVFQAGADWSAIGSSLGGAMGGPAGAALGGLAGTAANGIMGLFGAGEFRSAGQFGSQQRIMGSSATSAASGDGYGSTAAFGSRRQRIL